MEDDGSPAVSVLLTLADALEFDFFKRFAPRERWITGELDWKVFKVALYWRCRMQIVESLG